MEVSKQQRDALRDECAKHTNTEFLIDECIEFLEIHVKTLEAEKIEHFVFPTALGHLKQAVIKTFQGKQ